MEGKLLYDADCGFCTLVAMRLPVLRLPVEIFPLRQADLESLGVSAERACREMPYVSVAGEVFYGHAAVAAALRTGRLPVRSLGRFLVLGPIDRLSARIYAWVAGHRHELPGGTAACELGRETS